MITILLDAVFFYYLLMLCVSNTYHIAIITKYIDDYTKTYGHCIIRSFRSVVIFTNTTKKFIEVRECYLHISTILFTFVMYHIFLQPIV